VNPGTGERDHQVGDGEADDVDVGRRTSHYYHHYCDPLDRIANTASSDRCDQS